MIVANPGAHTAVLPMPTQDELKTLVAQAALQYIVPGEIVGVGSGSTVNKFILALGTLKHRVRGAVSSSEASSALLRSQGIDLVDANLVEHLPVYVDGADELDPRGFMVKGGGAALTREKIVAALADRFVCIADASKLVDRLGRFPLPVEVIPMASARLMRQFRALGGAPEIRLRDGVPLRTDNGQIVLDVRGLSITDPLAFESMVNQWPGVVTVGVFAHQKASLCLLASETGVRTLVFD